MKKLTFFLLIPLLVLTVFFVYLYISANMEKNKTYYFPQIEIYMKVYKPPFNKYGYVLFSKDSIFSFLENSDFVKVYKSETSSASFVFNPAENNKFFITDRWNNTQINQVNFIVKLINKEDTTFFEQTVISGANTYVLKQPYFEIFIEDFLQSVFYIDYNIGESPIKAEPIK